MPASMYQIEEWSPIMPACRTCKWFQIPGVDHTCSSPKMIYGYNSKRKGSATDCVEVENDEGWGMIPGPDFSCKHYEFKESA
jgi:hypothetical protein